MALFPLAVRPAQETKCGGTGRGGEAVEMGSQRKDQGVGESCMTGFIPAPLGREAFVKLTVAPEKKVPIHPATEGDHTNRLQDHKDTHHLLS